MSPICRSVRVSLSLFLSLFLEHVYVQVVVIMVHIFPWFYVQEWLKCPLWAGDKLPIQFLKKLTNRVFFSQIPKTKSIMLFMKMGS
jgi:hypothetical protein